MNENMKTNEKIFWYCIFEYKLQGISNYLMESSIWVLLRFCPVQSFSLLGSRYVLTSFLLYEFFFREVCPYLILKFKGFFRSVHLHKFWEI